MMSGAARAADAAGVMDDVAANFLAFLTDVGDVPEVLWDAGLAYIAHAVDEAREARHGRMRANPAGQLRRLREDVARGLRLVRLAAETAQAETARDRDLVAELHEQAVAAAKARRRAQTLPAQLARLEKQRRQRDGLPIENFHLRPDYSGG